MTETTDTPADLSWIAEAIKPTLNYWGAKSLIEQILKMVPDEEFAHLDFEQAEPKDDGVVELRSEGDPHVWLIGLRNSNGKPSLMARREAIEHLMDAEAVHRLDHKLWIERLAADKAFRMAATKEMVADKLSDLVAEDVFAGRVIYNVETGLIVASEKATDEDRAEAVAAYARLIRSQHEDASGAFDPDATVRPLRPIEDYVGDGDPSSDEEAGA